ncbi:probable membrane-associated kinase regulator 2 [Juglans microcarpa x Juglans regia]|uniref:probable membrane-associated kinase regulator 2 n=1 Tax=Juglans microcarpa x Juglans regia TaxID=2249226 RepID=UPI001B7E83C2|nr:probable membrane-associated kinase regulator 2 [Juglans microcarpa x Juglans regia]
MEAFSLLKYWRGAGGINSGGGGGDSLRAAGTTTIVTAVAQSSAGETDEDDDDDGPFFDLEFAVPDEDDDVEDGDENESGEQEGTNRENESEEDEDEFDGGGDVDGEGEFNFTLASGSSIDRTDQNLSLSPSDDLFFKGRLVPIEPSSLVFNTSEPNSKPPQFPVSLLKSATKFRVSMLGLKKPKPSGNDAPKSETSEPVASAPQPQPKKQNKEQPQQQQSKSLTVKFKVEEVPIVSLFTRDSSRSASAGNKAQKQNNVEESVSDEKRFSKEVMQKYLRKVKPLYFRVSKRYGEKLRFSGQLSLGAGAKAVPPSSKADQKPAPVKSVAEKAVAEPAASDQGLVNNVKMSQKLGNLPTGLRVVCKHLGKSRSASSSAVAAAPTAPVSSRRRDDSLLQQQDGIQGAILHCKRSFNASRDLESSLLSRSVSDPSSDKSSELAMKSSVEGKDGHSDQSP